MKIYISADIEGVAGITDSKECDPENAETKYFQEQMTAEVAVACEGALTAGAREIFVKDAHWFGRNIDFKKLPDCVQLSRSWSGHPYMMVDGLTADFDAVMFVGYHSSAGSGGNPLSHTLSGGKIAEMRLNGKRVSEFHLNAYTAGLEGVPIAFLSGDRTLCSEAKVEYKGLSTVETFYGLGPSTVSRHPEKICTEIKKSVEHALVELPRHKETLIPKLPSEFHLEIDFHKPHMAYARSFYPGVELKTDRTLVFQNTDYFEVLRMLQFMVR